MISLKGLFKRNTLNDQGNQLYKVIAEQLVNSSTECHVDFAGISHVSLVFFQDFIFPLITEFGSETVSDRLRFINIKAEHWRLYQEACAKTSDYIERLAVNENRRFGDISDITCDMLIKARELSRRDPPAAMVLFGFTQQMVEIFSTMDISHIRRISAAGIICFEPRFTAEFAKKLANLNTSELDVFLNIIGDIKLDSVYESEC
jgi:hypothetical protein